MSEPSRAPGALFLSHAPEDVAVARRLADALRAFGIEVWLGESDTEAKIRTCARFVPLISAATQTSREGAFRREWELAAERARGLADGVPFLLPVIIDGTPQGAALVPDEFRRAPITRLEQGGPTTQFIDLVKRTLTAANLGGSAAKIAEHDNEPERARVSRRRWLTLIALIVILVLAAGGWWLSKRPEPVARIPVIVLMDTTYADRVYDPATLKAGGSNTDDIAALLHDLPVRLVQETTSAAWRREAEVVKEHPALVIIHRSAFYTFPADRADELYPLADNKLVAFMGYLAAQSPGTRFIVYSRHSWEVDKVAAKWRDDAASRFPQLAGKIQTWRVPLARATFRNQQTALELRATIEQKLGVRGTPGAP